MSNKLPPIYFYIPKQTFRHSIRRYDWFNNIPQNPDVYWKEYKQFIEASLYCWIVQTYSRLKASGFPCEFINHLPEEGIVLTHRDCIPIYVMPTKNLLIVCIQSDRAGHVFAQLHIVNKSCGKMAEEPKTIWESYYIPHWPLPGIIPRDPLRNNRFENIVYFGRIHALILELRRSLWDKKMSDLGLKWHIIEDTSKWNDYSFVDAVIAVRNFKTETDPCSAVKLYNAWHAGVPAILGAELGYQLEKKSELDYIEVSSVEEIIGALKRLRDDKGLYHAMVENGRIRAQETNPENLLKQWESFLTDIAVPAYEKWRSMPSLDKKIFILCRFFIYTTEGKTFRRYMCYIARIFLFLWVIPFIKDLIRFFERKRYKA